MAWRTGVWIVLLAFTLQSFITQTHIHGGANPSSAAAIVKTITGGQSQSPIDGDPASCPFCQAITNSGAFFISAAAILPLPNLWAEIAAPPTVAEIADRISTHGWHSRAPPQH